MNYVYVQFKLKLLETIQLALASIKFGRISKRFIYTHMSSIL